MYSLSSNQTHQTTFTENELIEELDHMGVYLDAEQLKNLRQGTITNNCIISYLRK